MNWKKNVFSYILWSIYGSLVCAGVVAVAGIWCKQLAIFSGWAFVIGAVSLTMIGLLVVLIQRFLLKESKAVKDISPMRAIVTESVFVVVLVAVGLLLRIQGISYATNIAESTVYFETAKVAEGQTIPQMIHGASYLYLQLLHGIFIVFGNKLLGAVWIQIVLQILAAGFLYFAVRKLTGTIAAVLTVGYMALSPYMIKEAITLSPRMLYLALYAVTIFIIANMLTVKKKTPLFWFVGGLLIGFCCYMDIFGVTLLALLISFFGAESLSEEELERSRWILFLKGVISAILGFVACAIIEAINGDEIVWNVFKAWGQVYDPDGIGPFVIFSGEIWLIELSLIFIMLAVGIFSFWYNKKYEKQAVWIGMVLIVLLLQAFQMTTEQISGKSYLYLLSVILAAAGVESIFVRSGTVKFAVGFGLNKKNKKTELQDETEDFWARMEAREAANAAMEAEEAEESPKVKLLDNPLPLPKKHEPKEMDYKLADVSADYDYDIDVADDDDFDIV